MCTSRLKTLDSSTWQLTPRIHDVVSRMKQPKHVSPFFKFCIYILCCLRTSLLFWYIDNRNYICSVTVRSGTLKFPIHSPSHTLTSHQWNKPLVCLNVSISSDFSLSLRLVVSSRATSLLITAALLTAELASVDSGEAWASPTAAAFDQIEGARMGRQRLHAMRGRAALLRACPVGEPSSGLAQEVHGHPMCLCPRPLWTYNTLSISMLFSKNEIDRGEPLKHHSCSSSLLIIVYVLTIHRNISILATDIIC